MHHVLTFLFTISILSLNVQKFLEKMKKRNPRNLHFILITNCILEPAIRNLYSSNEKIFKIQSEGKML